ncbi:hypothetical protein ABZZ79_00375 [Streptomyces sp. NPDC006458]|uniref:hypothetical protein n=1 Tax=Streptomyces sp. NPDC006458 TaxID=3154302 RepID=UPI0033AB8924
MGDRTRVDDLDVIKSVATDLSKIVKELERLDDEDKYGWNQEVIGHAELTDRLNDFAANWDYKRSRLEEDLKKLAGVTKAAAEAYDAIDTALADAVRRRRKKSKGKA